MGKKYIIELNDECNSEFKGIIAFGLTQEKQISVELIPEESMTPYTEPDLEQVRNESFKNGYDAACKDIDIKSKTNAAYRKGLEDAWECARKIGSNSMCSLKEMGFDFGQCVVNDYNPSWFVVKNYSASECIEKIRKYEQEKEEQIQVGDEVIYDGKRCVVVFPQTEHLQATVLECGRFHHTHVVEYDELTQTGRHVPELVEILQKMKEES